MTKSRRKMFFGIFLIICLMVGLGITSLALVYQKVTVEDNLFVTGQVKISLNDDQPIFREDILFEPGMVVQKEFTLSNDSTCDVHYRLYFTNIEGEFAKALQVEVLDQDEAIFEGNERTEIPRCAWCSGGRGRACHDHCLSCAERLQK